MSDHPNRPEHQTKNLYLIERSSYSNDSHDSDFCFYLSIYIYVYIHVFIYIPEQMCKYVYLNIYLNLYYFSINPCTYVCTV